LGKLGQFTVTKGEFQMPEKISRRKKDFSHEREWRIEKMVHEICEAA